MLKKILCSEGKAVPVDAQGQAAGLDSFHTVLIRHLFLTVWKVDLKFEGGMLEDLNFAVIKVKVWVFCFVLGLLLYPHSTSAL